MNTNDELAPALLGLAYDLDHFQVAFGLLTEARQMPELRGAQEDLWKDWVAKLTDMVRELQAREVIRTDHDPYALALLWSSITGVELFATTSPIRPGTASGYEECMCVLFGHSPGCLT